MSSWCENVSNYIDDRVPHFGVAIGIFASICYGTANFLHSSLIKTYNPFQISFITSAIGIVLVIPALFITKTLPFPAAAENRSVAFTAAFQVLTSILVLFSLKFIPIFDEAVIADSSPMFIGIVTWVSLREDFGMLEMVSFVAIVTGMILVSRPSISFTHGLKIQHFDRMSGSILAVGVSLSKSLSACFLRQSQMTSATVVCLYILCVKCFGCFVVGNGVSVINLPERTEDFVLFASVGALNVIVYVSVAKAFKCDPILLVATSLICDIPTTLFWQVIIYRQIPVLLEGIGALLVIVGILLITFRQFINEGLQKLYERIRNCRNAAEERSELLRHGPNNSRAQN